MAIEAKPGSTLSVKLTKNPTNEAAAKTLSRIFGRDSANKKARARRKKLLASSMRVERRGGRPWEVRSKAPRLVQPRPGDSCKVFATTAILRDLASVSRFVSVSAK